MLCPSRFFSDPEGEKDAMPTVAAQMIRPAPTAASTVLTASGSNADAVITLPAIAGRAYQITGGIAWSYSGAGTLSGGNLTIKDGSTTVFDLDISAKGQDVAPAVLTTTPGNALVVTLAAGGSNVTGKVNLLGVLTIDGAPQGSAGQMNYSDWQQSGWID